MGHERVFLKESSPSKLVLRTMLKQIGHKVLRMTQISVGFRLKMGLVKQTIDFSKCDNSKERMHITICVTSLRYLFRKSNFLELASIKFSWANDRDSLRHIESSSELQT